MSMNCIAPAPGARPDPMLAAAALEAQDQPGPLCPAGASETVPLVEDLTTELSELVAERARLHRRAGKLVEIMRKLKDMDCLLEHQIAEVEEELACQDEPDPFHPEVEKTA